MKTIHKHIYNPAQSLFKENRNDRAICTTIDCSAAQCPLRDLGQCCMTGIFLTKCPYGKFKQEIGFTKRAAKYSSWIREKEEKYKDVPTLKRPPKKMAFIGDYVYLPYAHLGLNKSLPLIEHTAVLSISNSPFLPKNHWTLESVFSIIDFCPNSLFGSPIHSYQTEQVPLFLQHLREMDPEMWAKLIERRPELDQSPDYVGRTARVNTLNYPITWSTKDRKYPVEWVWDGTHLNTSSPNAYNRTWGEIKEGELLEVKILPSHQTGVVVQDNAWVNKDTVFLD